MNGVLEQDTEKPPAAPLDNLNGIKVVLMLLVVGFHSLCFFGGNWFTRDPVIESRTLAVIARWLGTFHVHAFTLVSGYLFAYLQYERGRYPRFLPFCRTKAKRLLVPYVSVLLFWVIPFHVYFFPTDGAELLMKFGWGTAPSQLWFLLMLFVVFMLAFPLSRALHGQFIAGGG